MPTVAPEDDEYSMNDVSLGSPETMSLDDVKQFFEVVKPVEKTAPTTPRTPGTSSTSTNMIRSEHTNGFGI